MKFIYFLKTPIQYSPGKTEKDFPFVTNFFHFGLKPMESKKIKNVVSDMIVMRRLESMRKGRREAGEIFYRRFSIASC
jgi:hypothetical protein